jgi:hypothetical protein
VQFLGRVHDCRLRVIPAPDLRAIIDARFVLAIVPALRAD